MMGHLRPLILMPVGLLTGLPAVQIESFLLHELAHIRRYDYLVDIVQTSVESLLFYHPLVWWISRVIRSEREDCADDIAVGVSGDPREYAGALVALEESRWCESEAALAATGGNLMKRVRRLLNSRKAIEARSHHRGFRRNACARRGRPHRLAGEGPNPACGEPECFPVYQVAK